MSTQGTNSFKVTTTCSLGNICNLPYRDSELNVNYFWAQSSKTAELSIGGFYIEDLGLSVKIYNYYACLPFESGIINEDGIPIDLTNYGGVPNSGMPIIDTNRTSQLVTGTSIGTLTVTNTDRYGNTSVTTLSGSCAYNSYTGIISWRDTGIYTYCGPEITAQYCGFHAWDTSQWVDGTSPNGVLSNSDITSDSGYGWTTRVITTGISNGRLGYTASYLIIDYRTYDMRESYRYDKTYQFVVTL